MKFAVVLVGILLCYIFTLSSGLEREEFRCVEGAHYQENECNMCRCMLGNLACTRRACKTYSDPKYMDCEVGTTWTKNCNKCWCSEAYQTVCTIEKC